MRVANFFEFSLQDYDSDTERTDLARVRRDLTRQKPDLIPEKPDLIPEKPDLIPEKPDLTRQKADSDIRTAGGASGSGDCLSELQGCLVRIARRRVQAWMSEPALRARRSPSEGLGAELVAAAFYPSSATRRIDPLLSG